MKQFTTINPYTQEKISSFQYLSEKQLEDAVQVASRSQKSWRKERLEERKHAMLKIASHLERVKSSAARLISGEMGKPLFQSEAEIEKCSWVCRYYAENAADMLKEERFESNASQSWVQYDPLGVILGIMPWNFPFWQVFRFAVPTIMAGNTVLIKHAPNTFGSAAVIHQLFSDVGFPKGVYTNLVIEVDQVESLLKHAEITALTLTGSEKAGSAVASFAGKEVKKSVLELGGSNAFIVFRDANLEQSVDIAIEARMQNNGQSCIAAKRFLIDEQIIEDFISRFKIKMSEFKMGDPLSSDTTLGPLARLDLAENLEDQINRSIKLGASLVMGGKRNGNFIEPTILTNCQPGMPAFDEELFGPVAAFAPFREKEEAIAMSNESQFGLGVSICTEHPSKYYHFIKELDEGAVFFNEKVSSDPRLPFGGVKKSGFGRELGVMGIKEFVNAKTVCIY